MADVPVSHGQIVLASVVDPQGRNPKVRPCVVVSNEPAITAGGPVRVVCITGTLDGIDAEDRVDLPWHRSGHPRTGLNKPSAADCSWQADVALEDVVADKGRVPDAELRRIVLRLEQLAGGG